MKDHRFVAAGAVLAFLIPLGVGAAAFIDTAPVPERAAIEGLAERGIIEGYDNGTFRPANRINRAEFIKILIGARFPDHTPGDVRCFLDLEVKTPQWYANPVCSARDLGIVSGYPDGTFKPDRTVNLAEALKMALRTFGIVPKTVPGTPWYEPYLNEARSRGLLVSLLKDPAHLLTRAEMASLTYALVVNAEHNEEHPVDGAAVCGNGKKESIEQCDDGNVRDSDGCSSICILVPEPIRRAILQIDMQASGTLTQIAQGQKNVTLLAFNAVTGRQDAAITTLVFRPSVGSLSYATNYRLVMDRNGDGSFETAVATGKADGSTLIFERIDGSGIHIAKDVIVPFKITADLVSALGPVSIGLNFAVDLPEYVQAHGTEDGLSLTGIETDNTCTAADCFIRVNTLASRDINVVDRGNLWVTQYNPLPNQILLGGSITGPLLSLRLRSDGETIDVHEIRIDGVTSSIDSLLLYTVPPGQSIDTVTAQPFAQASTGQCSPQTGTRMCAVLSFSVLNVTSTQDVILVIAAKMKSDALGGASGQSVTLSVSSSTNPLDRAFDARGNASQHTLDQNDGDSAAEGEIFVGTSTATVNSPIIGKTHDTAFASIASIVNAGVTLSTSIPAGNNVIGSFKITASPHVNTLQGSNDVILQTMTFAVSAQNVQIDPASFRLITAEDPSSELSCAGSAATGQITVSCTGIDGGSVRSHIGSGEFGTYQLKANVTNTQIAPGVSSLLVELPILRDRSQINSVTWSDEVTNFTWVYLPVTSVQSTLYQTH